jgi:hypothetical protein
MARDVYQIFKLAKTIAPQRITDYRPITLLNADYKISARILANRMHTVLPGLLHPSQYCTGSGNVILDATAGLRDVIANGEMRAKGLCLFAFDFTAAFDRLSHRYLRRIIQAYGYGRRFTSVLMSLYAAAESSSQINGYKTRAFPINSTVRQGCPLSMLIYVMALNPLLVLLDDRLTGVTLGPHFTKFTNIANADDVTVIVTYREDVVHMFAAVAQYERVTGATINYGKSKALPIETWDSTEMALGIPYVQEAKILGISFRKTMQARPQGHRRG